MFVDIRGFTAGAQSRTPTEVVDRLDSAFAVLVEIVDRQGGIVNKFWATAFSRCSVRRWRIPTPRKARLTRAAKC